MPFDSLPSTETDTDLAALIEARNLVSQGWGQFARRQKKMRSFKVRYEYCMVGAIAEATTQGATRLDACGVRLLYRLANEIVASGHCSEERWTYDAGSIVICFNDWEHRKQEHVLSIFDQVIARMQASR